MCARILLISIFLFIGIFTFESIGQQEYSAGINGKKLDWFSYYLQEYYVDTLDYDELTNIAIRSVMKELDPYSKYQTKEEIERQLAEDSGYSNFGIGLSFVKLNETVVVSYLIKDAPAENAGLKNGDALLTINGKELYSLSNNQIEELLENDNDTIINLSFQRGNETRNTKITKTRLPFYSISSFFMVADGVGYIKQDRFNNKSPEEFRTSIDSLRKSGMQNLIWDLRNNRGGTLKAAVTQIDECFSDKKLILYKQGFNLEREEHYTENLGGELTKGKIAVLVNEKSMSASELVASALQDWDRAIIIGQPTFGKGLVQQSYKMPDKSALRLTIGKYYSPSGRCVQADKDHPIAWVNSELDALSKNDKTAALTVPDALKWQTMSGRKIIAGLEGRITPDIYAKHSVEKPDSIYNHLRKYGIPYKFATWYAYKNRDKIKNHKEPLKVFTSPHVNYEIDNALVKYVNDQVDSGNLSIDKIEKRMSRYSIDKIKGWIIAQVFDDNAYYQYIRKSDELVMRAIESFTDGSYEELQLIK